MDIYTKKGEWGGYVITKSAKGFIVQCWSARQGEFTGEKYLLRYTDELHGGIDLAAKWNPGTTYGDMIYNAVTAPEERVRTESMVLRRGHIVQ